MPNTGVQRSLKWLPLIVFMISTVVAAVRLEGRVNAHDQLFVEREKMILSNKMEILSSYGEIAKRLDRIENKVDALQAAQSQIQAHEQQNWFKRNF